MQHSDTVFRSIPGWFDRRRTHHLQTVPPTLNAFFQGMPIADDVDAPENVMLHCHSHGELTGTAWQVNHTSQVKSIAGVPNSEIVLTGSQFTDDQSVTSLDAQTGKVFWSSDILASWTYGVSVHEDGVVAFGCPFDTG